MSIMTNKFKTLAKMKKFIQAFKEAKENGYVLVYNTKYNLYLQVSHQKHLQNDDLVIIYN